jgi:hypothetical protein
MKKKHLCIVDCQLSLAELWSNTVYGSHEASGRSEGKFAIIEFNESSIFLITKEDLLKADIDLNQFDTVKNIN